ncbi:hypothetical protein ACMAV8_03815 [Helicobacter pylori]
MLERLPYKPSPARLMLTNAPVMTQPIGTSQNAQSFLSATLPTTDDKPCPRVYLTIASATDTANA